jgi:hypothetical protein
LELDRMALLPDPIGAPAPQHVTRTPVAKEASHG